MYSAALLLITRYAMSHMYSGVHNTTEGIEVKNEVFLQSFGTKYASCYCVVHVLLCSCSSQLYCIYREEDIEGDVIRNPTTVEDDPETKVNN